MAAFNPCGFAMLPACLSFFVTGSDAERRRHPVARALTVTAAMTVGFVLVFAVAGLAAEAASVAIVEWTPWVTLVIGLALIPLGLFLLVAQSSPWRFTAGGRSPTMPTEIGRRGGPGVVTPRGWTVPRRRRMMAAGVMVAGALALSACGGDGSSVGQEAVGGAAGPGAAAEGGSPLPAVDVVDVASGETVALASLLPADKPTLVWMWAPF